MAQESASLRELDELSPVVPTAEVVDRSAERRSSSLKRPA
jgi:hypothetical protein